MKDLQFFLERIEKRTTEKNESLGECWIWTGATGSNGRALYCDRSEGKRNRNAARDIFKLVKMPTLQEGIEHPVLHHCQDQSKCINPDHLYYHPPTVEMSGAKRNRLDAIEQQRIPYRKIKGKESEVIRLFKEGIEQQEIGQRLDIHRVTIQRFLNGQLNQQTHNYVKEAEEKRNGLIKKLYEEGKSITQITLLAKTCDTVIYSVVPEIRNNPKGKETNENKKSKSKTSIPERNKQIKLMKEQGKPVREIALEFGISIPLVYIILKQV